MAEKLIRIKVEVSEIDIPPKTGKAMKGIDAFEFAVVIGSEVSDDISAAGVRLHEVEGFIRDRLEIVLSNPSLWRKR